VATQQNLILDSQTSTLGCVLEAGRSLVASSRPELGTQVEVGTDVFHSGFLMESSEIIQFTAQ